MPGTAAERAGLQPGDRIVEIAGKSTKGWTNEEAGKVLRGKPGSFVTIKIERPGVVTPIELRLQRTTIHQSAVRRTAMLSEGARPYRRSHMRSRDPVGLIAITLVETSGRSPARCAVVSRIVTRPMS